MKLLQHELRRKREVASARVAEKERSCFNTSCGEREKMLQHELRISQADVGQEEESVEVHLATTNPEHGRN